MPIRTSGTSFSISHAAWYQAEDTFFIFYSVSAEQGISPESQVEISYVTDSREVPWTNVRTLKNVHTHVDVTCGRFNLCGSVSPFEKERPRNVRMRLRYHRDGETAFELAPDYHAILTGDPFKTRSFLVYGVFNEENRLVQWRGRHQFPALRNHEAQELGLRREFRMGEESYGNYQDASLRANNPYLYGSRPGCPFDFSLYGDPALPKSDARSQWSQNTLPFEAAPFSHVCAKSWVKDGRGEYEQSAFARKNPEVTPAFEKLHTPISESTPLKFLLALCKSEPSKDHLELQKQRLSLDGNIDICLDTTFPEGLSAKLASEFRKRIDLERVNQKDMILTIGFHHAEENGSSEKHRDLAKALEDSIGPELEKSSPRAIGAFVFDSIAYGPVPDSLKRSVLWCPSVRVPRQQRNGEPPTESENSCPVVPDFGVSFGSLDLGTLPIFPTRQSYLSFLEKKSKDHAGKMKKLSFYAPLRTPISENVQSSEFGVSTFYNSEVLSTSAAQSFSYCAQEGDSSQFVFRPGVGRVPLPLSSFPSFHKNAPQDKYEMGLTWDFPYLARVEYEAFLAAGISAFSGTLPFGIGMDAREVYGTEQWFRGDHKIGKKLLQCVRFCNHPAFDSAGVYDVRRPWNEAYLSACYRPLLPTGSPLAAGFPYDP